MALRRQGFLEKGHKYVVHSIRDSTHKSLKTFFTKWVYHCEKRCSDPCNPSVNCVAEFLVDLFEGGLSFSSVKNTHAAIRHWIVSNSKAPDHVTIVCMMRGFALARPPQVSIKKFIWDVNTMLHVQDVPNDVLPVHLLAKKTAMLLLLHTMCHHNTLSLLTLDKLEADDTSVMIRLISYKKQVRLHSACESDMILRLCRYDINKNICPVSAFLDYVSAMKSFRQHDNVFIICKPPFMPVRTGTLSHWTSQMFQTANITGYKPHSCRAASASGALRAGVLIGEVLLCGGWANANCFVKHYARHIHTDYSVPKVDKSFSDYRMAGVSIFMLPKLQFLQSQVTRGHMYQILCFTTPFTHQQ